VETARTREALARFAAISASSLAGCGIAYLVLTIGFGLPQKGVLFLVGLGALLIVGTVAISALRLVLCDESEQDEPRSSGRPVAVAASVLAVLLACGLIVHGNTVLGLLVAFVGAAGLWRFRPVA
jgi:hypothetical protein